MKAPMMDKIDFTFLLFRGMDPTDKIKSGMSSRQPMEISNRRLLMNDWLMSKKVKVSKACEYLK